MAAPRSPPPRQLSVNRLTGCTPWRRCSYQFLSPYRNQNVSDVRGAVSRLARVKFLQDVLLGWIQRPLPKTSDKAGHLKKHRTSYLMDFIPGQTPARTVQANQPNVTRAQMRQAAGFLHQLGPSLAGYPGIPALIMESKLCKWPPSFAAQTAAARTRVDKPRINPGTLKTQVC